MSRPCAEVLDQVRSTIRRLLANLASELPVEPRTMLDVGCWDGEETTRMAATLNARACGIEVFPEPAAAAAARGVEVARVDLERDRFPWPDQSMDVVVVNQVFEHLKNVWLPMSEIHRVTRERGWLILSVPNLGSLHNRALMACGRQPTSIRTFGPHVRGYVAGEIARFVGFRGAYQVKRQVGVGFYPLPAKLATPIARAWPGASHTTVVLARKPAGAPAAPWLRYLETGEEGLQTFYAAEPGATTAPERPGPARQRS